MLIKKSEYGYLSVMSHIYFDDNTCFCGRPYMYLSAHKKNCIISITIHDNDDFDIGMIYKTDEEHFFDVLHELINWMRDHEQGITQYNQIWDPFIFFPDCECTRE